MGQKTRTMVALMVTGSIVAGAVYGHCEIPCGIYDDKARVGMLREHTRTVEKSMEQIQTLAEDSDKSYNQLIRWTDNKEEHAKKIQDIIYQYFMNQRIKVVDEGEEGYQTYLHQITLLHQMAVQAMKCKQTTDTAHVEKLRELIDQFEESYFSDKKEETADHAH